MSTPDPFGSALNATESNPDPFGAALSAKASGNDVGPDVFGDALSARAGGQVTPTIRDQASDNFDSTNATLRRIAKGTAGAILGGYAGIESMAKNFVLTGDPKMDEAANAVQDMQRRVMGDDAPASPREIEQQRILQSPYNPINYPAEMGAKAGELEGRLGGGPGLQTGVDVGTNVLSAMLGGQALGEAGISLRPAPRAGGMGPAAEEVYSAPTEKGEPIRGVSPEISAKVDQTLAARDPALGPVDRDSIIRHTEAASLPHPVPMTPGQAAQDPALISREMNNRGTPAGSSIVPILNNQNTALVKNLNAVRDNIAPDSGMNANPQHAQTLMNAYEAKDTAANADISGKYQNLINANGGQFPVDGNTLVNNIDAALKQKLKTGYVPSGLQSALQEFRDGRQMNFEDFETLRSDSAEAMRNGTGSEKAAAGIIRQELEKLPLQPQAAKLKPLADEARQAAQDRFDAIKADPAYKAVVDGTAKSNTFADRYVLGAAREHLQAMQDSIGDQPQVAQAIGGIATNQLRARAGIDSFGNGNFAASGYNKALESLRPNLDLLVDQPTANHLNTLGNVARYTQFQPRGSFVNNSNSAVAAPGIIASLAAKGAEHGANVLAHGVPVGTVARTGVGIIKGYRAQKAAAAQAAADSAPFAGSGLTPGEVSKLSDLVRKP